MNLRIQDIFKYVLPGFVIMVVLFLCKIINFSKIQNVYFNQKNEGLLLLFGTCLFFLFGYLVDLCSSNLERFYYKIGTKPSQILLNNLDANIYLASLEKIIEHLSIKMQRCRPIEEFDKKIAEEYFRKANQLKDYNTNNVSNAKLLELYYQKTLSRNLSVSFLLSIIIFCVTVILTGGCLVFCDVWYWLVILLFLFSFTLYRWTQHAMYYSRQVFYNSCEEILK